MPPATARLGRAAANARASRRTVSAGTSVCFSTSSGVYAATASAIVPPPEPSPSLTITLTRPSASAISPPGLIAIHSSALAPVSESRGSTAMKRPPSPRARIAAKSRACWTGVPQVSRKSAPNDTIRLALAKSVCAAWACPNVRRLASSIECGSNASNTRCVPPAACAHDLASASNEPGACSVTSAMLLPPDLAWPSLSAASFRASSHVIGFHEAPSRTRGPRTRSGS